MEFDQIFAFIETFDCHNIIVAQKNWFDINRGFMQALNLFDTHELKVDHIRLTNTSFLPTHLNTVR